MNDGSFPALCKKEVALPPLLVFAFAPLLVKTMTVRCKVRPEANAWLEQAAREVNQVWNFANATSFESLSSYTRKSLPPKDPSKAAKKKKQAGKTGGDGAASAEKPKKEKTYAEKSGSLHSTSITWWRAVVKYLAISEATSLRKPLANLSINDLSSTRQSLNSEPQAARSAPWAGFRSKR